MSISSILCNIIPFLFILHFISNGWRKGALYMFISLLRLIVSYLAARWIAELLTNSILSIPDIYSRFEAIAQSQIHMLQQLPGISLLLTGNVVQAGVETITWWLLFGLCYLVIFIAFLIFFSILLRMSRALNNVVVIGWFNRLFGALEGLVFGTVLTLILVYLIAYLFHIFGFVTWSQDLITSWLPVLFTTTVNNLING